MTDFHLTWAGLGLAAPVTWLHTLMFAVFWTGVLYAYSPTAAGVATRLVKTPPKLGMFRALQESTFKLVLGIALAWLLGAFLEELLLRGIVVNALRGTIGAWPAVAVAAAGAF